LPRRISGRGFGRGWGRCRAGRPPDPVGPPPPPLTCPSGGGLASVVRSPSVWLYSYLFYPHEKERWVWEARARSSCSDGGAMEHRGEPGPVGCPLAPQLAAAATGRAGEEH